MRRIRLLTDMPAVLVLLLVLVGVATARAGSPGTGGHPAAPGPSTLPEGHPPLPGSGQPLPPDAKATLVVQTAQGTRGGPPVSGDTVTVDLVHAGRAVKRVEAKLDDQGRAVLPDLPVGAGVRPVVRVRHGGVTYEQVGERMQPGPPDQHVMVVVYETTNQRPALVIRARHLIVSRTSEGLYVKEMLLLENPSDRAWVGQAEAEGSPATFQLQLPIPEKDGRVDFFAGFHECCTRLDGNRLISTRPVVPGKSQFVFGYLVPVHEGEATLRVAHPTRTDRLAVVIPDDGSKVLAQGLEGGQAMQMGRQTMRLYQGKALEPDQAISVRITGIPAGPAAPPPRPAPAADPASGSVPKKVATAGAAVVLVGGLGLVLWKRPRSAGRNEEPT